MTLMKDMLEEENLDAVDVFGDNLTGAELSIMAAVGGLGCPD